MVPVSHFLEAQLFQLISNFPITLVKIFSKVSRAAKTDFIKVSSWSAASTLVKMATSFVSIKVVSSVVGPPGIAMVGQFLNGITMVSMLATGGIGQGVTKFIAQFYDEPEKQKSVITNALKITLAFTALMSLLVILFSSKLTLYIFKTSQYRSLIILFGLSIALYSLNSLLVSILNGFKAFKKFVLVNIASSLFSLCLTLFLVLRLGLFGALLNCVASQSVVILVTCYFLYKEPWFAALFKSSSVDWSIIKKLSGFTLMALTSAIVVPFAQLSIRSFITTHLSLTDAGLWEGINRLSGMYLMLITTSISIYYLPRLAEIKENHLLRHEIIKTAKLVLPPLAFGCLVIYLSRDLLIWLIFSKEFYAMRSLFAFQMLGDFLKIASFFLAFIFWAKGMTKTYIAAELVFNFILVILVRLGVSYFGLQGSVYAYALTYLLYLITVLVIFRRLLFHNTISLKVYS